MAPKRLVLRKATWIIANLALAAHFGPALAAQAKPADRSLDGVWNVVDSTNNNTGRREVYAFQMAFPKSETGYVTLTMRCSNAKPTFFVDWTEREFPDQTVLTFSPVLADGTNPNARQFIFEKSADVLEHGLKASPETSAQIVSTLGSSASVALTAHLPISSRTLVIEVEGTLPAWSRVVRHCPVQIVATPPP